MGNKKYSTKKIEKDPILGLMELPFEYLKIRAIEEDLPWELEIEFFVTAFKGGIREFFGLQLDDMCFPLYDLNEPKRGFLNTYISCFLFPCEQ